MHLRAESIENVIDKYTKTVYGIALTHVKNRADADDVFQEVFLAYYQTQKLFQDEEHQKAWLIRTTINYCKKITGSAWRKRMTSLDEATCLQTDAIFPFELEQETLIFEALRSLPSKYRNVMYLHYFEGLTVEEISRSLRVRPGTVRMQLTRGRSQLKELLKGDFE